MSKDYTSTLNLPKTDFPMRASLPQREPQMLEYWDKIDLYGSMLTVAFLGRVREERCFSSLSALTEQIKRDCEEVRAWKQQNGPS